MPLFSTLAGLGKTAMSALGGISKFGSSVGGAIEGIAPIAKIAGIPMPGDPTGKSLGQDAKSFMDAAYPGTNPWEQLGSNAGSAVGVARQTTSTQEKMQEKELRSRERVAQIQAKAATTSAAIQHGPAAIQGVDEFWRTGKTGAFTTQLDIAKSKLGAELNNLRADTANKLAGVKKQLAEAYLTRNKGELERAKVSFADELAKLHRNKELGANTTVLLTNAVNAFYEAARRGVDGLFKGESSLETSVPVRK